MARIGRDEFLGRLERCAAVMGPAGMNAVVLFPGPGFSYFTGLRFARERYRNVVAIVDSRGGLTIMGPSFEEEKLGQSRPGADVETWTDMEDQYARIAKVIQARFGSSPVVGLELTTDYYHLLGLQEAMPDATLRSALEATDELRAIKSSSEIECLVEAVRRTRARLEKVPSQLELGMTEKDLSKRFGPGGMIQFGLTTASPNAATGNQKLQENDIIVIDAGDWVEGYRSDITRTFFYGEPTGEMRRVYDVVDRAKSAAIKAAVPGAPASIVDTAARRVIEDAGLGGYFTHRGGHGLGLAFHEIPICAEGSGHVLRPGMVLTTEPGVYLPGKFGIRLEDDLLITDSGCEVL